ncbi:hypothetical protein RRF57_012857 [Xylaria bambusicola]|uniref:Uncharacterized protein n=1 Tax=Xylaria bambusicola TaxID=326684 RepID=A0AAN7Z4V4_9PEZI
MVPYERQDENRPEPKPPKKKKKKKKKKKQQRKGKGKEDDDEEVADDVSDEPEPAPPPDVPEAELGMGGPENRVYWPIGMEEWLRPRKREVKKKARAEEEDLGTEKGQALD